MADVVLPEAPATDASWEQLRSFAVTFDGYEAAGSFAACAALGNAVRAAWREDRVLPLSLDVLRTALYWEQRRQWHVDDSGGPGEPDSSTLEYIRALVAEIRRHATPAETDSELMGNGR